MSDQKICFIIAPIGEPESDTRKRSDQVLKHIIKPAASACNYHAVRADEIDKPGIITSQVIQHVLDDALVVADLTERNPNVFYELAIRHAIRRPIVQLIQKGEQIPFDVAGTRTLYVDHHDLDSAAEAKDQIIEQIRALEEDPADIETPISVSLDLQKLRGSENPEDWYMQEVLSALTGLSSSLRDWQDGNREHMDSTTRTVLEQLKETGQLLQKRDATVPTQHKYRAILYWAEDLDEADRVLVLSSAFRDSMPWIYELGIEYHRCSNTRSRSEMALRKLRENIDRATRYRMAPEFFGHDEYAHRVLHELAMAVDELLHRRPINQ